MKKNNLIRFVQSLVLLPVMTMSLPMTGVPSTQISQNILARQFNNEAGVRDPKAYVVAVAEAHAKILSAEAKAIDAYFAAGNMPLKGTGAKMVLEAEKNNLDWRLLPAIAVRESTGGKNACKNNPFGWGSCKIGFKSNDEAIETIAKNLGGNNPSTARHYKNKTIKQILNTYNPPSIIPHYTDQVLSIMDAIGDVDIIITPAATLAANT